MLTDKTTIGTTQYLPDICSPCPTEGSAYQKRRTIYAKTVGPVPRGHKVAPGCGNELCANPLHIKLERWATFKEDGKYASIRERLLTLQKDEGFDLPEYPSDEASRTLLTANLSSNARSSRIKFAIRSLPTGGVRVIYLGTRGTFGHGADVSTTKHPVLCYRGWNRVKPSGQAVGAFFLGLLYGTWDTDSENRIPRCSEKGCVFPQLEGFNICRQHVIQNLASASYPQELRLDYRHQAYARKSDDKTVSSFNDAEFHSGWLTTDRYGFTHTTTLTPSGHLVHKPKYERQNDKWWKENVIDKGIKVEGVVVPKTDRELKEELDVMLAQSIDRYVEETYTAQESMRNIRRFFSVKREENPIHEDPMQPNAPRLKIGEGATASLHGKMRRSSRGAPGIRKKQRIRKASGWSGGRHAPKCDPYSRDSIRGLDWIENDDINYLFDQLKPEEFEDNYE
jgi:hypothetical protein